MSQITVSFFGLCCLVDRGAAPYEVYLPTGKSHKADHVGTLAIPVKDVLDTKATTWKPNIILHHQGVQVACWIMDAIEVTFNPGGSLPTWEPNDRKKCLDFSSHYVKAKKKNDMPVLFLSGGHIKSGPTDPYIHPQPWVARYVTWFSGMPTLTITSDLGRISATSGGADVSIGITNVSSDTPAEDSDHHFQLYYEELYYDVPKAERKHLQKTALAVRPAPQVYDCVPPGTNS